MKKLTKILTVFLLALLGANLQPAWGYSATFYCVPEYLWGDSWDDNDDQWVRANFMCKQNNQEKWHSPSMTKTGKKYHGYDIYSVADGTLEENGVQKLQFQRMKANSTTVNATYDVMGSWWGLDGFNNKMYKADWNNDSPVWYDYSYDPVINYAHLYYTKNGGSTDYKFDGDKSDFDLGTITSSFTVTNIYINFNKNGGNVCATKDNGAMCYKVNNGTNTTRLQPTSGWTWSGTKDPYELQWTNASKTIASSTDPSGKYTLHIWWELKGDYAGESNCTNVTWYYSNSGKNYNWTYTILPPAVSNFGVTPSGAVDGTGTQQDPFIMPYNGTLTLTVNSLSQAHTDANSTLSLTGTGSNKTLTKNGNVFTISGIQNYSSIYSVTISAKYHNSSANLDGAESTVTYYYKMGRTSLTLDKNNNDASGSNNGSSTVNLGSKSFSPTAPTRTGYEPDGYYLENGCTTYVATASGNLKASISNYTDDDCKWIYTGATATLYTNWKAKKYALSFDDQGATTEHSFSELQATYNEQMPTFQSSKAPKKTGYTFQGYYTGTNGSGTKCYNADGSSAYTWILTPTGTTTLYAYWAPNVNTIVFNANTGTGDQMVNQTFTYGQAAKALSKNTYTKTGYHFIGWARTADGAVEYTDEQEITNITENTENVNLYAKWEANVTNITLYRNYNNEDVTTYELSASYDCTIGQVTGLSSDIYTRTGYTHSGIYAARSGGSYLMKYDNSAWKFGTVDNYCTATYWKYEAGGDLNLYSHWSANKYNITFNQYEPTTHGDASKQVTFDASVSNIAVPAKTGLIFSGYYTEENGAGIEVFTAAGALVANASGYTSNGKWVYANNITLHAYWATPAEQVVNFGITDGSAISNTLGTITAKVDDVAINSGDKVASGSQVIFEYSPASGTVITGIKGTKLQNWYDGVNTSSATSYGITQNSCTLTVSASTVNAYAYALALEYTVSTAVSPVGKGEVTSNNDFRCGPNLNTTLTAVNPEGYDFVNWTADGDAGKVQFTGETTVSPINVAVKEAERTVTANFQIHNYSITYEGVLDGSEHTNPETYTIETETITFNPATSVFGHKFTSWNPATITTGSTGDKTITAQYGAVSLAPVASDNIIEGKQATITPNLTAPTDTYHYEYTCANIPFFNVGANGVATFTAPAAGNYTITLNVYEGSNAQGVKLATTNVDITVNEDLSTNWKLVGDNQSGSPFGDNYTYDNGKPMTKAPGHSTENIAYYSLNVTTLGTFEFKVAKGTGNENFYGWGQNDGDYITFNRDASGTEMQVYSGNQHPLKFTPDMVGEYVFKVDYTTNDVVKVTVTYPTTTTYNVDVYYDGVTKTTVEGGAFAKSITAQVPESMIFDHWEVEGEMSHVNITNTTSQTTTFTASGDGAVIRAKFNTNKRIYLKGGSNFSDAYMNFYKSNYWNSDLGTGNKGDECVGKNWKMYKVTNTDIFWLDISSAPSEWKNYFSFVNKGDESDNFYMCNVVYRDDMTEALPFYVPRNSYASEHHNSSQYFNEGIWMKYNSTESGYDIRGFGDWEDKSHRFIAETPGGYEFKTKLTLTAGTTYEFKIYNDNGTNYGATDQTMTATSCTNWKMHLNNGNCKITTSEAGEYTFVLNLGSGEVIISVEYPLSASDYRVVAKDGSEVKWEGDLIKHSNEAKKDTTSFFNNNYTFQLQQYAGEDKWNNIGDEVTITDGKAQVGVINLIVEQDGQGNATLTYEGVYKGNYYIRTDGVDGGWGSYKTNPDNKMDNYGSLLVADPTYQYDVYKAKWVLSGKNVKFRIANDYSKAISDELKEDDIIDNKETLPQGANVRFMWNSKTNQLKRAYISGSTDTNDRYLVLTGDEKMFDEKGNEIPIGTAGNQREGLLANELPFKDMNNWVYQADIKAQPQCAVKLTAKYNNQVQYFIGAAGEETGSRKTIIAGNGETQYTMRVVYDFKTNLLIAGWVPDGKEITDTIKLGGDMLITRTHQDSAQQIIFGTTGSIEDIHHIYGVLSIKKDTMLGTSTSPKYKEPATNADYERTMYWISFPFKVKISEIFGVDGYGTKWIMQKYRGDLRAQKGWFKQDTPTFWEYMDVTDSLNAYEGYLFLIDANYFNTEDADVWKNSATEANFYFPSASGNIGIINKSSFTQEVPENKCGIDREFEVTDSKGNTITVNHKNTDSYWNVIGVPAFQNKSLVLGTETKTDMKAIYEWNSTDNTYTPRALKDAFRFQTMHAYMVQFGGDITWSDVSVVNTKAPYRYAYADTKNYFIKLFFGNNEAEDHAYINLADEASTDFVLNEDMMKLDNAGYPNIYSFAGNYNVAYNETKMTNQSVTIGVSAPKDGSYTFSMPKDFSGSAILVDLEEGTYTDLNVSNYSVDLNKGTYNNRFQLMLEVEAKTPTNIQNANGGLWSEDGKTQKLLINDQIYLINGGRVYNATGVQLR